MSDGIGSSGCWIGGEPTLPLDVEWPYYDVPNGPPVPMHFAAQIDLSQSPLTFAQTGLPEQGTLFFFYDPIFAPCYRMLKEGRKVIYVKECLSNVPARVMPEFSTHEDHKDMELSLIHI